MLWWLGGFMWKIMVEVTLGLTVNNGTLCGGFWLVIHLWVVGWKSGYPFADKDPE